LRLDAQQFFASQHTPSHLESILRRARFDGSIATAQSEEENASLLAAAAEHAYVKGVIACAGLNHPKLDAALDSYQRHPFFRGVVGPDFRAGQENPPGLNCLERRGIPLDVAASAAGIPPLLDRHPDLNIAIVNLGFPDGSEAWFRGMERAAQSPRAYVKVSGLISSGGKRWTAAAVRPFVAHALTVFGPHRVMFGSDWPSCLPDSIWKETLAIFTQAIGAQSMETREWLLGESARAFYGIGAAGVEGSEN